ncbi:hypothetical protein CPC08DRAFT_425389 [Agrocybe pediades]|nr:hypothetical protein CPC08DRAFT_425389 [Agrocybe pediades]
MFCQECCATDPLRLSNIGVSDCTVTGEGGRDCYACADIRNLQREAQETWQKLENILARVYQAKRARNTIHSTILHKMPNEVTVMIFRMVLDDADSDRGLLKAPRKSEKLLYVLTLSGVCTQWRAIALAAPRLWADVHVFIRIPQTTTTRDLDILKLIMERSKAVPLTISFLLLGETYSPYIHEGYREVFRIVGKECERWHTLRTYLPRNFTVALLEQTGRLSNVSSLQMYWEHKFGTRSDIKELDAKLGDKWLGPKRVSLTRYTFKSGWLSWEHTAYVVAHSFCNIEAFELLQNAPGMKTCVFTNLDNKHKELYDRHSEGPFPVHRKLRCIKYHSFESSGYGNLLTLLDFPSLDWLDYTGLEPAHSLALGRSFRRCTPPLRKLRLEHSDELDTHCALIRLLKALPTIKRLILRQWKPGCGHHEKLAFKGTPAEEDDGCRCARVNYDDLVQVRDGADGHSQEQQRRFLPRLQSFEYVDDDWSQEVPWHFIQCCLRNGGANGSPGARPLKEVILRKHGVRRIREGVVHPVIPKDVLFEMLALRRAGASIKCTNLHYGEIDWFQASLEFHGLLSAADSNELPDGVVREEGVSDLKVD